MQQFVVFLLLALSVSQSLIWSMYNILILSYILCSASKSMPN